MSTSTAITVSGRTFQLNGDRWSPKGLCYQPTDDIDPISDNNLAEIKSLTDTDGDWTKLKINAIRVYQVDHTASHDLVMAHLASKGIYVMVGCVNTKVALPRTGGYPCDVLTLCKNVVDTFIGYDNVLSFSVSNELLFGADQPNVAAVAKALVRDVKAHVATKVASGSRSVPVGLVLRDDQTVAKTLTAAAYYASGSATDRADFIGYNQYRWCAYTAGSNAQMGSMNAWWQLYDAFKDFPVPVYFSEYGCNSGNDRNWDQVPYLFGTSQLTPNMAGSSDVYMSDVLSGGFAFRYIERTENLGLVTSPGNPISGHGFADLGTQYTAITSFKDSSVSGTDPLSAPSGYDPTMPTACGVTGPHITIKVTNEITPEAEVGWSYCTESFPPNDSTVWVSLGTFPAGSGTTSLDVPTAATYLSFAYKRSGTWYGACQRSMTGVSAGDTVRGIWTNNAGTGTCPLQ